jgi:hypothetical protein
MSSQRSQAIVQPVDETTIGQGDCAFNAFALGFCTPRVLNHLDEIYRASPKATNLWRQFIDRAAPALGVPANWPAIKEKLWALRQRGSVAKLQQILAPLLRELAVSLMRHDMESMERTIEPLTTAFRQHAYDAIGLHGSYLQDDVYRQHHFIQRHFDLFTQVAKFLLQLEPVGFDFEKYISLLLLENERTELQQHEFAEMVKTLDPRLAARHVKYIPVFAIYFSTYQNKFNIDRYKELQTKRNLNLHDTAELKQLEEQLDLLFAATQKILSRWWRRPTETGGYQRFLNQMQRPGEWAGDLELAVLASYFNLNLDVYLNRTAVRQRIHFDCGTISYSDFSCELTRAEIEQLVLRGIVDRTPYLNRVLISQKEFEKAKEKLTLALLPIENDSSLQSRLDHVPAVEQVRAFIHANAAALKGKTITAANGWSSACIAELLQRDVIVRSPTEGQYRFSLDAPAALARVAALPQCAALTAQLTRSHRENAVIALRHAVHHWNNVLSVDESKAFTQAQQSAYTETNLYRETLVALQQNKIQYNEKRWQDIITRATNNPNADTASKICYAVDGKEDTNIELSDDTDEELRRSVEKARAERFVIYVDAHDANALDEELAKKMQVELYEEYKQRCHKR